MSEKVYNVIDSEKPFGNCESLYGKFGRVDFINCVDVMKRIADNVFDLAFWDPPFNVGYGQQSVSIKDRKYEKFSRVGGSPVVTYSDNMTGEEYVKFLGGVLHELVRISRCVVAHTGIAKGNKKFSNERLWFENFPP